ncbi:regulatory phage cox family protein [Serratia ficaria]|uniref:regulatory phage cox family protein n=1 Tax=Serratia ficaria TaxID=61651 RepID=UPI00217C27C3|nr:regulatory phage cox family protein [Serratia ficaria]CAI1150498.1 Regulatory phage protein cox [Serratia ficaria]CAI2008873.1 Regulatory phage protein cox [Serratia ficaria]CAI2518457.1 Regulatory phage protein cox [Serratia ficaria]
MNIEDFAIRYPIDGVTVEKFAELLGKPHSAVVDMVKRNKLPVIELRDPEKVGGRAGDKYVYIPAFNQGLREAFMNRPIEQRDAWLLWMGL